MPFDRNEALEHYSKAGGNQLDSLRTYCREAGSRDAFAFAKAVDEIQGSLWGIVLGTMGKKSYTESELESLIRDYVFSKARWVDDRGIGALKRWLVWMAWHEGCLDEDGPGKDERGH